MAQAPFVVNRAPSNHISQRDVRGVVCDLGALCRFSESPSVRDFPRHKKGRSIGGLSLTFRSSCFAFSCVERLVLGIPCFSLRSKCN